jgi:predicted ATPase
MTGTVFFFRGQYEPAREHLEAGLEGYAELSPAPEGTEYAWETAEEEIRLRVWLAHVLLGLGYPAQAIAVSHEALTRSQRLEYIGAKAIALTTAGAAFYATLNQPGETLRYAEQLSTLATRHALPAYQAWSIFYRGWAIAHRGESATGISEMHAGIKQLEATGTQGSFPQLFTLLAETYARRGNVQEGEEALKRALAQVEQPDSGAYLAETYRVQGMLRLKGQDQEGAQASFRRAIGIAREQAAHLWELRATVSLARLWAAQGRVTEAANRLSDIYGWFTEGFDVPDLVAARALLERLRAAPGEGRGEK